MTPTAAMKPPMVSDALPDAAIPSAQTSHFRGRLNGIDALRGLMVALMVLDHVRDFFTVPVDALALDSGDPALFMTRWVTHLCAPTFVFLAGVSIWFQTKTAPSRTSLSRRLAARGLWLIALEFTIIGIGFNFGWWLFFQVIWAIGVGFIVLAALIWLPRSVVLVTGILLPILQLLLGGIAPDFAGDFSILWRSLAVFGPNMTPFGFALVAYPALPWVGIMLLGYGFGFIFTLSPNQQKRAVVALALSFLCTFAVLRGFNVNGLDPRSWAIQDDLLWSVFSVLNISKYPPSPGFALITLGLSLLLLPLLERLGGRTGRVLLTFGRTPFASYLAHIWLAHGLALLVGIAMGVPVSAFANSIIDPSRLVAAGWGFNLWVVYLMWGVTLILLYPFSRWTETLKTRHKGWWVSYI